VAFPEAGVEVVPGERRLAGQRVEVIPEIDAFDRKSVLPGRSIELVVPTVEPGSPLPGFNEDTAEPPVTPRKNGLEDGRRYRMGLELDAFMPAELRAEIGLFIDEEGLVVHAHPLERRVRLGDEGGQADVDSGV
jgi:hypothetical protein